MEYIAGILTGYVLTWPALGFLIAWAIYAEHRNSTGWAVFVSIIAALVAFFMFDVQLKTLAYSALAYLGIGIVWSFWRYKRFVEVRVEQIKQKDYTNNDYGKRLALDNLSPKENTGSIVAWIVIWPISLIENLVRDVITGLEKLVRTGLNRIYTYIYSSAIRDV